MSRKHAIWRTFGLMLTALVAAALTLAAASCGDEGASSGGSQSGSSSTIPVELLRSEADRSQSSAPDADVAHVAQAGTRFALDLFHAIRSPQENLAFSPHSLSTALGMTLSGARGDTEKEMLQALGLTLSAERVHPALNSLALELQRSAEVSQKGDVRLRLHQADSLWGQKGQTYQPSFLDLLAEDYGAAMRLVENLSSEEARLAINYWVQEETGQQIPELLPPGALASRPGPVYLVLVNTLTLSAPWKWPFPSANTSPGTFYLPDGAQREVPMMRQTMPFPYAEGAGYQAIELPYVGEEFGMVILLPSEGTFEEFARSLDEEVLREIVDGLDEVALPLTLPRFSVEWRDSLKETLQGLGMRLAFDPKSADFSGMNGSGGIWVDDVYHASRITVDEVGTEAAAGSAVVMIAGIGERKMVVDRPFLFLIRDRGTGAILFMGQVVDPAQRGLR